MAFAVGAAEYDRFMGRFSVPLAPLFADFAGVSPGQRVLDVGCGPGALTNELVARVGADAVFAVDPSERFVTAARDRHPGVRVDVSVAESLPFEHGLFDVALAQLVVHFMTDPISGFREMDRVTRTHGVVAACVWDYEGGHAPPSPFWKAARAVDPTVEDPSRRAGTRRGHLAELLGAAGLHDVEEALLTVEVEHASFEEWWEPFTLGVGPVGSYVKRLDAAGLNRLRDRCRTMFPEAPFVVSVCAWAARGRVDS
jgi:SAM-dependent methyltransferase